MYTHSERKRGVQLLETVAAICVSKEFNESNQNICKMIANHYYTEEKIFTKAYSFSLRANNLEEAIKALE